MDLDLPPEMVCVGRKRSGRKGTVYLEKYNRKHVVFWTHQAAMS